MTGDSRYKVINHEEQYTVWPVDEATPAGWKEIGKTGDRPQCLRYIEEVWTDLRPELVRRKAEELASRLRPPRGRR